MDFTVKAPQLQIPAGSRLPELVIYSDSNFRGKEARTNLAWYQVGDWNDQLSSFVVVSGTWELFQNEKFNEQAPGLKWVVKPGYYASNEVAGFPDGQVSSFRPIAL